jgi:hypothetical protein
LTEDRAAMNMLRLYEKLRLYQPLGCLFQPDASMPEGSTVAMPSCLLCGDRSNLPPAKTGYLRGDEPRLFQICADCDCDQAEIERKVAEPVAVAAE